MDWFIGHWHWAFFAVGVVVGLGVRLFFLIMED